jgi:hypothetical protein
MRLFGLEAPQRVIVEDVRDLDDATPLQPSCGS